MSYYDPAFEVRGFGQNDLGGAAGSDSTDSGGDNSLISGGAEGGTSTSQLLGADGSDPTYSGTTPSGGGGGGGSYPSATSPSSPSSASSALSSLTSGNTPLILGAIAVVGGVAGALYLAHRHAAQSPRRR